MTALAATLIAAWGLAAGPEAHGDTTPIAGSTAPDLGGTAPDHGIEAPDAGLGRFYRQRITWHGCRLDPQDEEGAALDEAGARCADVTVPLDYRRPHGRTVTVAISRLAATGPGRIGAMVVNLGGPAIPALGIVPLARQTMGETGARFDLLGMDRRFVGRSSPLDCGLPVSWIPRSAGTGRRGFDRMVAVARDTAARCTRRHADVLPHASTADTARDLDVVRAALGESKLSYLGFSQGTYLGAMFAELFPHRAGRIVLDSAIDPTRAGVRGHRDNAPLREAALRDWAAWAAERHARYHLGDTVAAVLSTVDLVYRASARRPLRVGRHRVDDTVLSGLLIDPLSDDDDANSAELASRLQVLVRAATGRPARPTPELETTLTGILTGERSAAQSANAAILCADAPVPRDPRWYRRDIEEHRAEAPLFGPLSRVVTPCAFWPREAVHPRARIRNAVPALVVQATGDINADYGQGVAMHRALTGSRLVTLEGVRTHGVYALKGSTCVDDTVDAYLRTGVLPTGDVTCPRNSAGPPAVGR